MRKLVTVETGYDALLGVVLLISIRHEGIIDHPSLVAIKSLSISLISMRLFMIKTGAKEKIP